MRAVVRAKGEGAAHAGWLEMGGERVGCVLGARGLVANKEEGDGGTPVGVMPLRRVLYRADRLRVACAVAREPIAPDDGWCDEASDPSYNRMVRLPHGARAERLWRDDGLYDVVGVLGWNDAPPRPGSGSAIFLHVAPEGGGPTQGCVGLALPALLRLLRAGLTELETVSGHVPGSTG